MKPACGSGEEQGEYDLPLHVAALCTYRMSTNIGQVDGLTRWNSYGHGLLMPWYEFLESSGSRELGILTHTCRSGLSRRGEEGQVDEDSTQGVFCMQAFRNRCLDRNSIRSRM